MTTFRFGLAGKLIFFLKNGYWKVSAFLSSRHENRHRQTKRIQDMQRFRARPRVSENCLCLGSGGGVQDFLRRASPRINVLGLCVLREQPDMLAPNGAGVPGQLVCAKQARVKVNLENHLLRPEPNSLNPEALTKLRNALAKATLSPSSLRALINRCPIVKLLLHA